jgi:hypothetical protein
MQKIAGLAIASAISADDIGNYVPDVLRYTITFMVDQYTCRTRQTIGLLQEAGFDVLQVKNYWACGNCYKGINSIWVQGLGTHFEVQFHTPESFQMKENVLHPIYERRRVLFAEAIGSEDPLDGEQIEKKIQDLEEEMRSRSAELMAPKDVQSIGTIVYDRP